MGWEFTAQAIAAYEIGLLPNSSSLVTTYLQEIEAAQNAAPFGDGLGVVAAILENGDTVTPPNECLSTPFQCLPERVGIAATSWATLVDQKVNPMSPGITPIASSKLSLTFASQVVGSAAPTQSITLTNSWAVAVNVAVYISGTNGGDFSQTGCPTMLCGWRLLYAERGVYSDSGGAAKRIRFDCPDAVLGHFGGNLNRDVERNGHACGVPGNNSGNQPCWIVGQRGRWGGAGIAFHG